MMCKHVAAVLYGVSARLDAQPELLFTLRQVDSNDLVTQAAELPVKTRKTPARSKVLDDSQLADVFGIVMDTPEVWCCRTQRAGGNPPNEAGGTACCRGENIGQGIGEEEGRGGNDEADDRSATPDRASADYSGACFCQQIS